MNELDADAITEGLEVYLVGGAVRDQLLGLPINDRDYVVVGATSDDMLRRGFKPVGQDFPVFLHPQSGDEYALARTERKTGPGYRGFQVHAAPDVSLEQDLARRDLTINAMAMSRNGRRIDPFGGAEDLERGVLRHVSGAFVEDPVRILRTARFAARYALRGMRVAPETMDLMRSMVSDGEVDALVAERIWQEVRDALMEPKPSVFFEALRACGALARIFPELERLWGVPQTAKYHPEIDTGVHVMMALDYAAAANYDTIVRYAVLMHDLGKGITPKHVLPSHRGHDEAGVRLVESVSQRWRVPTAFRELAVAVTRWHLRSHLALQMTPKKIYALLEGIDALRRPERLAWFNDACRADVRGRLGRENDVYPQSDFLVQALEVVRQVNAEALLQRGLSGPELGEALRRARIKSIAELRRPASSQDDGRTGPASPETA